MMRDKFEATVSKTGFTHSLIQLKRFDYDRYYFSGNESAPDNRPRSISKTPRRVYSAAA